MIDLGHFDEALERATGDHQLHLPRQPDEQRHALGRLVAALAVVVGRRRQHFHRALGGRRVLAHAGDERLDFRGRLGRALGEFSHFVRDHGKPTPGFTRARRLDRRIQGKQVRLIGNFVD